MIEWPSWIDPQVSPGEAGFMVDAAPQYDALENRSPAGQADTWRSWDHSWPLFRPVEQLPGVFFRDGDIIELARAVVPVGYIGRLKQIDHSIIDATTGDPSAWNNPFQWADLFDWWLSLNPSPDRSVAARRLSRDFGPNFQISRALGGSLFSPLATWPENRFPWNNSANIVNMPIPSGSILRLFVRAIVPVAFPHAVQGRLRWELASETSARALSRVQG